MTSEFENTIRERRAIRAFPERPVGCQTLERIFRTARCAPSGANLQPGKFHVLTGQPLHSLSERQQEAERCGEEVSLEYSHFPDPVPKAPGERPRIAGYALYATRGIERRDIAGRRGQFAQNCKFFGTPVGVIVTIDRARGKGCFMDLGMAIMSFPLAVEDRGLGATGIGAMASYGSIVHRAIDLPEDETVVCGVAAGWPKPDAAINQFRTERASLNEFATFYGFESADNEEAQ
ncbi:MAG: nitroreductase [Roseovarius sp.]|nr:nitroreductase [Roseovarius sp.]